MSQCIFNVAYLPEDEQLNNAWGGGWQRRAKGADLKASVILSSHVARSGRKCVLCRANFRERYFQTNVRRVYSVARIHMYTCARRYNYRYHEIFSGMALAFPLSNCRNSQSSGMEVMEACSRSYSNA